MTPESNKGQPSQQSKEITEICRNLIAFKHIWVRQTIQLGAVLSDRRDKLSPDLWLLYCKDMNIDQDYADCHIVFYQLASEYLSTDGTAKHVQFDWDKAAVHLDKKFNSIIGELI